MKPRYIVAVSGGVDSVVLLDRLIATGEANLIVVHVDHGMRPQSAADAHFVARLARRHGLSYETIRLQLGSGASEQTARLARWKFLRAMQAKHHASAIATGHHSDDIVETMIINLQRGTGWRGIASLSESAGIRRPLLALRKRAIVDYALAHQLEWREDHTNSDTTYLRNRIRHIIIPQIEPTQFARFIELYHAQLVIRADIEHECRRLAQPMSCYELSMWPDEVAREALYCQLGALPRRELDRILWFVRTARLHKQLPLSNGLVLKRGARQLIVIGAEG